MLLKPVTLLSVTGLRLTVLLGSAEKTKEGWGDSKKTDRPGQMRTRMTRAHRNTHKDIETVDRWWMCLCVRQYFPDNLIEIFQCDYLLASHTQTKQRADSCDKTL